MDTDVEKRISQGFWCSEKGSVPGQKPDSDHQKEGFQGLCNVSAALWI